MVITDLGDSALLLPLALVLAAGLWSMQSAAVAFTWLGLVVPGLMLLTAFKLIGHACQSATVGGAVISPSGHAAFAAMVYGSLGVILANHLRGGARWLGVAVPAAITAGVAVTRVLLDAHSTMEVVVGLAVGSGVVAVFARRYRALPPARFHAYRTGLLLAGIALLMVALHGERLRAEGALRGIALELGPRVGLCR